MALYNSMIAKIKLTSRKLKKYNTVMLCAVGSYTNSHFTSYRVYFVTVDPQNLFGVTNLMYFIKRIVNTVLGNFIKTNPKNNFTFCFLYRVAYVS